MQNNYTSTKTCSKCKQEFPATTEYFIWHKRSSKLYPQCHECRKKAKRKERQRNSERYRNYNKRHWQENKEHYQEYKRKYHQEHAEEIRQKIFI